MRSSHTQSTQQRKVAENAKPQEDANSEEQPSYHKNHQNDHLHEKVTCFVKYFSFE